MEMEHGGVVIGKNAGEGGINDSNRHLLHEGVVELFRSGREKMHLRSGIAIYRVTIEKNQACSRDPPHLGRLELPILEGGKDL